MIECGQQNRDVILLLHGGGNFYNGFRSVSFYLETLEKEAEA